MAWIAFVTRFVQACAMSPASAWIGGRSGAGSSTSSTPAAAASGCATRATSARILRADESQEPLDDPVQPVDLARDDVQVLRDRTRRRAPAGLREAGAEELEVDAHGVEGVLHLVCDPGREAPESGQL